LEYQLTFTIDFHAGKLTSSGNMISSA